MTTNLAFVITESFTFHFYLEKWIVPLSYDYNVHIIGRFSDEEIVNLSKKFSIYSIKFHTVDIQRKISWKNDFLSIGEGLKAPVSTLVRRIICLEGISMA